MPRHHKPSPSDQPLEPDGLPARESSDYALEKLFYASRYMGIFATGIKNAFAHRVYIDLLAGPGRIAVGGTHYAGSPLLSLAAPFTQRLFVESAPSLAAALSQRLPIGADIECGDCNDPAVIARIRQKIPAGNTLGLAFADNLGLNVTFPTLASLTEGKQIDLMIVVQLQDLTRNTIPAVRGEEPRERFDQYFGTPQWSDLVDAALRHNAGHAEIASALLGFYRDQLKTIGYAHSTPGVHVMRNEKNAIQYRLLLAGKHPKAVEFFRKIEAIDPYGQRPLLGF